MKDFIDKKIEEAKNRLWDSTKSSGDEDLDWLRSALEEAIKYGIDTANINCIHLSYSKWEELGEKRRYFDFREQKQKELNPQVTKGMAYTAEPDWEAIVNRSSRIGLVWGLILGTLIGGGICGIIISIIINP